MNSECCVDEGISQTPDATDDSCITQFIEIVPLYLSRKDFPNDFPNTQVKVEFTTDIKQEPEDLCEVYGTSVVNVSFFVCFSLPYLPHMAALINLVVFMY